MKKNIKVILILLVLVAAVLASVYVLSSAVYSEPQKVLVYPKGALADNFMDAQTFKYTKNESLPKTYSFKTVPYIVDVPDSSAVTVGNGAVFQIQQDVVLYVSEFSDPVTTQAVIQKEFPQIILMNALPAATEIVAMVDETGKINSYNAEYIADKLSVSDGMKKQEAALFGYRLDMENRYAGKHVFVGIGTTVMSQEVFDDISAYLNAVLRTVRFDSALDKSLQAKEEKQLQQRNESYGRVEESSSSQQNNKTSDTAYNRPSDVTPGVLSSVVTVDRQYSELTINVTWTIATNDVVLELFSPDGSLFWSPLERDSKSARFVLQNVAPGNYKLNVKGSNTGEITVSAEGS